MEIKAGFDISFDCPKPTPMLLMLNVHPSRAPDLRTPHQIVFDPPVRSTEYQDGFGNTCTRILAPPGRIRMQTSFTIADSGNPDPVVPDAEQWPVETLPDEVIVFLLGSRYCDTDHLSEKAWQLFGATRPGWERVQAICDYVHSRITFGYEHARATRTGFDAHQEQFGVCRDFAHLAVTLCRCMNVPARYCTGYLGDIGVPVSDSPMDFSAWFEAFLDGQWYTFDARHNKPRIGRILMARGRDATDVALSTVFGTTTLSNFQVFTDEITS